MEVIACSGSAIPGISDLRSSSASLQTWNSTMSSDWKVLGSNGSTRASHMVSMTTELRAWFMRNVPIRKISLHSSEDRNDLAGKTPQELLGMVWPLTLSAWSFKEKLDAESRLQRHVVVLKKRRS